MVVQRWFFRRSKRQEDLNGGVHLQNLRVEEVGGDGGTGDRVLVVYEGPIFVDVIKGVERPEKEEVSESMEI